MPTKLITLTLLLTTLASSASASPTPRSTACQTSDLFTLYLDAENYRAMPLETYVGPSGQTHLVFLNEMQYTGVPVCISSNRLEIAVPSNSSSSSGTLSAVYNNPGSAPGAANPIDALPGADAGNATFHIENGGFLGVDKMAENQHFFACDEYFGDGEGEVKQLGLFLGTFLEGGEAPEGCVLANVKQRFNVPNGGHPPPKA